MSMVLFTKNLTNNFWHLFHASIIIFFQKTIYYFFNANSELFTTWILLLNTITCSIKQNSARLNSDIMRKSDKTIENIKSNKINTPNQNNREKWKKFPLAHKTANLNMQNPPATRNSLQFRTNNTSPTRGHRLLDCQPGHPRTQRVFSSKHNVEILRLPPTTAHDT